jgi:hypothetical protein
MTDELRLSERLQKQLDDFFAAQRQEERLSSWLGNRFFMEFFQDIEKKVCAGFAAAIEQHDKDVARLTNSNLQQEVRVGALELNDQKLQMYFDTYKRMAEEQTEMLISSFKNLVRG